MISKRNAAALRGLSPAARLSGSAVPPAGRRRDLLLAGTMLTGPGPIARAIQRAQRQWFCISRPAAVVAIFTTIGLLGASPVWAQATSQATTGGTGGGTAAEPAGGVGGANGAAGGAGQSNTYGLGAGAGGGGGGAGAAGGDGGAGGVNGVAFGPGGGGGAAGATGAAGGNGGGVPGQFYASYAPGGGGGGGGGSGTVVAGNTVTISSDQTGGAGGAGGSSTNGGQSGAGSGGGGGGGAGGYGVQATGASIVTVASGVTIQGGAGGAGGASSYYTGGQGGGGGGGFYGSGVLINQGVIQAGAGGASGVNASPAPTSGAVIGTGLAVTNTGTIGVMGQTGDSIAFISGVNSLTLSSGGTTGTLNGAIGVTGSLAIDPGVAAGSNITLTNLIQNDSTAGAISKIGAGTLTLTGANTYTGGTTVTAGVLYAQHVNGTVYDALGAGAVTMNGGSLNLSAGAGDSLTNAVTASGGGFITTSTGVNLNGAISGAGALAFAGNGGHTILLNADNSGFTGSTTVQVGMLQAGTSANAFSANSTFAVQSGAILALGSASQSIGSLTGSGQVTVTSSGSNVALTTGVTGASTSYSGTLTDGVGTLALVKTGAGNFSLNSFSSYSGGTTISGGQLSSGSVGGLGTGAVVDNATLLYSTATGTVANAISGTGALFVLNPTTSTTETFSGALTGGLALNVSGGGTVSLTNAGNTRTGATNIGANTTLSGTTASLSSGAITDNGVLAYNQGTSGTVASAISGGGALTFSGGGQLILTGANTYTGGTTVSGYSNFVVGDGGANGSITGPITLSNGNVFFQRTGGYANSSAITGTGASTVFADGVLTLNGAITTSGGVAIDQIGSSVTLGGTVSGSNSQGDSGYGSAVVVDQQNATLNVASTGQIQGGSYIGVRLATSGDAVNNLGSITNIGTGGTDQVGAGVAIYSTGGTNTITNGSSTNATATISGQNNGIDQRGSSTTALTLNNYGTITSSAYSPFENSGSAGALTVNNYATGVIYGPANGLNVNASSGVTLLNSGKIVGSYSGVSAGAGPATITNSGVIAGGGYSAGTVSVTGTFGVYDAGLLKLSNTGQISASASDAVTAHGDNSSVLNAGSGSLTASNNSGVSGAAGLSVVNAAGATLAGGTSTTYGYAVQFAGGTGAFDNFGTANANGRGVTVNTLIDGSTTGTGVTVTLEAGSTTGALALGGQNDTVSLYTGAANAAAVTTVDPVSGGTVTARAAGTYGAATFSTIALGGGTNILNLLGSGDGASAGAAGALNLANVTGATTIAKSGLGTWTLSGATGSAAATIKAGSGGAVNSGGVLAFNGTTGLTGAIYVDGAQVQVSGTGALGTGVVHLIDPNITFTSTSTQTNAISLDVATAASNPASNVSNDPSTFSANAGVVGTLSGAITTGTGSNADGYAIAAAQPVVIAGAGVIALTNTANSWTGATTVNSGATLTGGYNTISGSSVVDNGALNFNLNTTGTFAAPISGSGSLTQSGTGNLTLSGANTYTGVTTVSAGTLTGTTSSIVGSSIVDNGTLAYNQAASGTVAQNISGTGGVTVSGLVSGGASNGNTLTFSGTLTNHGLTVSDGSNVTLTGSYTSTASLNPGTGTFTNFGAATVSGDNGAYYSVGGTFNNGDATHAASLTAGATGIYSTGTSALTVNNYGLVSSDNYSAVLKLGGGAGLTVVNNAGGVLYGKGASAGGNAANSSGASSVTALNVTNNANALIVGAGYGVYGLTASDMVVNTGTIASGSYATPASPPYNAGTITAGGTAGVDLTAGGTITNQLGGLIEGGGGVLLGGAGTVSNLGTIKGVGGGGSSVGVELDAASTLNNGSATNTTALVEGANSGLYTPGAAALTINNYGTIRGDTYRGIDGGTLTVANYAGGAIVGTQYGVFTNQVSTVTNAGTITGSTAAGVDLQTGGTLTNSSGGQITGSSQGVQFGSGTVLNGGSITGQGGAGVSANSGALSLTNISGGSITGATFGVSDAGTLTLVNAGTITRSGGVAISVTGSSAATVSLLAGSSTTGSVSLGSGADTLNLYTGTGTSFAGTTTTDPVGGGNLTLQTAGTHAAASFGSIALGTGANVLNLLGAGDGSAANGAASALNLAIVTGAGTINQSGGGTWALSGSASGAGVGTINAGAGGAAGSGGLLTFATTGLTANINVNASKIQALTAGAFGTGVITLIDPTAEYSATGTYANAIHLATGSAADPNRLQVEPGVTATLSGNITQGLGGLASQPVVFDGGGTAILTGTNVWTGSTTISNGAAVSIAAATNIGTGALLLGDATTAGTLTTTNAGAITLTDAVTLGAGNGAVNVSTSTGNTTLSGVVSGSGRLIKTGAGELTLSAVETYTGLTQVLNGGGTLALSGTGSIASSIGLNDNGVFDISGVTGGSSTIQSLSGFGSVVLGANTLTINGSGSFSFGGVLSGAGGLAVSGPQTQTLSDSNTYAGPTTIASGAILSLSGTGSIAASSGVADTGTFDISGLTHGGTSVASLSGAGGVALGANTLTLTAASGTYSGAAAGTGGLTVSGGTETLTGANTFTGATTIGSGATLALSGAGSLASASGVADAGTFDISGHTGGATIAGLSGPGAVTLGANTLTLTGGGTYAGVASGTGGLTVAAGSEILTGNNTYAGTTTVSGGNLTLGAGGTTGSVAGPISLNSGVLTINRSNAVSLAAISGAGSLVQAGSGVTTLTGANTYTGSTTISAGTLALTGSASIAASSGVIDNGVLDISGSTSGGAMIATLAGSGTVQLGANSLGLSNASTSFGGSITGSGGLVVFGGVQTLSGANTYTGATTIAAGTLVLGPGGSIASGLVNLTGPGAIMDATGLPSLTLADLAGIAGSTVKASGLVTFGSSNSTVFAGSLTTSGALTKVGSGTLALTGANSYVGPTTISSGVLAVSGGSAIPDASVVTVASGAGFSVLGSETVASIGGAGSIGIASGAALTFGGDNQASSFGSISGAGDLIKTGAGTFILSGANTSTGKTTVAGGALQLANNATISGAVAVNGGASLTGTGRVGALTIASGATLSPGVAAGDFGTITANSLTTAGTIRIDFGGNSTGLKSDNVIVTGAVNVTGGTIDAHPTSATGDYTFNQYFALTAGTTFTGQFANSTSFTANPYNPLLLQRIRYDLGPAAVLEVRYMQDLTAGVSTTAGGANAGPVAIALNATETGASDSFAPLITALAALNASDRTQALKLLSGEGSVDGQEIAIGGLDSFLGVITSHLAGTTANAGSATAFGLFDAQSGSASRLAGLRSTRTGQQLSGLGVGVGEGVGFGFPSAPPQALTTWAQGYALDQKLGAANGLASTQTDGAGFAFGADTGVGDHGTAGFAFGYADPRSQTDSRLAKANGETMSAAAYGRWSKDNWFAGATVAYASTDLNFKRTVKVGALTFNPQGSTSAQTVGASLIGGYRFYLRDGSRIDPMGTFDYTHDHEGAYAERNGGAANLGFAATNLERYTVTAGARWSKPLQMRDWSVTPEARAAVAIAGGDLNLLSQAVFIGAPAGTGSFQVQGAKTPSNWGIVGAGLSLHKIGSPIEMKLNYEGAFASRLTENRIAATVAYKW